MDQNKIWENFGIKTDKQNPRALAVNTVLAGKYLVGPVLGEGGFGITYVGYDLNMEIRIAIKEYFPVELVTRDTTRRSSGGGGSASNGSVPGSSVPGASVYGGDIPSAGGVSSSGGGSDRVISLSGEKSKTYQQGLKKYVDEARNVSQFADIPGIVSVKDFFYENDTAYIVMEYIEGISLKEYLKQKGGKLSEEEALAILCPVLEALEKVHAAGIVHRDISPDNIMLTFAEKEKAEQASASDTASTSASTAVYGNISAVKLIDFGAARMTSKNDQKSLTIILKHGYAPEEQYRSHGEQGPWTDVYALCAVLYRMLTGKVPEPAMDRLFSDGLKSPEELGVKVSPAVSEAVMKGLAVKKEDRIQSVRELMDALYAGKKLKRRGNGKLSRPALVAAAAAGVLILIVAAVGIGMAFRDGNGMKMEDAGAGQDDLTENAIKGGADSQIQNPEAGEASPGNVSGTGQTDEGENTVLLEEAEEEEIAFYSPQNAISGNIQSPILMCLPDGSVKAFGDNSAGQCRVDNWGDVVAVSVNVTQSLGLDANGTVYAAGDNSMGECDVDTWSDIVAVAAGFYASFGLKTDGTVVACGDVERYAEALESWKDIKAITAFPGNYYGLVGLDRNGNIFCTGFDEEMAQVTGWEDVEQISINKRGEQFTLAGIREDGSIVSHRLTVDESSQEYDELETWTGMKQFSMNTPVLGVRKDGTVACSSGAGEAVQAELASWSEMEAVTSIDQSGGIYVVGITQDGEIREYRENTGNVSLEEMKNLKWVHVLPDEAGSIAAGTTDGRLLTYGQDWLLPTLEMSLREMGADPATLAGMEGRRTFFSEDGSVFGVGYMDRASWSEAGVKQVVELWDYLTYQQISSGAYALLMEDGSVRIRTVDDELEGSGIDLEKWLGELKEAEKWTDVRELCWSRSRATLYGLHEDGSVSASVGQGFSAEGRKIEKIEEQNGVLAGMTEDGKMILLRFNEDAEEMGLKAAELWEDVTDFALGDSHIVGLLKDGTVIAAGSNHAGQCDVEDWENIVFITTGRSCTLGITADGDLKIAGSLY